jgi:1,4-dihydroxy-2-naphthoate octaprenyltransferase
MRPSGNLFNFFVYSNLFIAGCAILMVNQTYRLLIHTAPDFYFLSFVFFSTICSYSFHWYLTSHSEIASFRIEWVRQNRNLHLVLFVVGFIGSIIFFLYLIKYWPWLVFGAIITFLYSAPKIPDKHFRALRKIALGKTIFLALVWTYITTILPVIVSDNLWQPDFYLFTASRFFLIYAICILFDYRDRADDKAKGIRSLITYLNETGIRNLFAVSLFLFFVSTGLMLFYDYSLFTIFILLLPGIITASLYNHARKNLSDIFYYFILDGLMALSALLMLLIGI